jgi:hypothetical protein
MREIDPRTTANSPSPATTVRSSPAAAGKESFTNSNVEAA